MQYKVLPMIRHEINTSTQKTKTQNKTETIHQPGSKPEQGNRRDLRIPVAIPVSAGRRSHQPHGEPAGPAVTVRSTSRQRQSPGLCDRCVTEQRPAGGTELASASHPLI